MKRGLAQRKWTSQMQPPFQTSFFFSLTRLYLRAWHAAKYIDPAESGAVLPIVHVNGFKISERTVYGCMDDKELITLFSGYGYQPKIVENLGDIDTDLHCAFQWAIDRIRTIQSAARNGKAIVKPRWPVILLRTPKVGSCFSCFLPLPVFQANAMIGHVRSEGGTWTIY